MTNPENTHERLHPIDTIHHGNTLISAQIESLPAAQQAELRERLHDICSLAGVPTDKLGTEVVARIRRLRSMYEQLSGAVEDE